MSFPGDKENIYCYCSDQPQTFAVWGVNSNIFEDRICLEIAGAENAQRSIGQGKGDIRNAICRYALRHAL